MIYSLLGLRFVGDSPRGMAARALSLRLRNGQATLATPNALMLAACRDSAIGALLRRFDLLAPDGDGIALAARLLGKPVPPKCAGVEIGWELVRLSAARGLTLFLCGGKPGVAERAAARLGKAFPSLVVVGTCDGYRSEAEMKEQIFASGADVVLVGLGFPKQERFVQDCVTGHPALYAALGGSLDIYAGILRRAPRLFRCLRAEWLWRVLCEPRRLCRLAPLPGFFLSLWRYR